MSFLSSLHRWWLGPPVVQLLLVESSDRAAYHELAEAGGLGRVAACAYGLCSTFDVVGGTPPMVVLEARRRPLRGRVNLELTQRPVFVQRHGRQDMWQVYDARFGSSPIWRAPVLGEAAARAWDAGARFVTLRVV